MSQKPTGGNDKVLTPKHPKIKLLTPEETFVKALIYAEPGTGKTHLACTAPNPILLITETAVSKTTVKNVERITGRRIPYWEINTLDDLEEAYDYLVSAQHDFQTVVLDGITDIYHRLLAAAIDFAVTNVNRKSMHDPDLPEQSDWQRVGNKLRTMARLFRDLPMDVVITALVMDVRNEMRSVPYIQPSKLALEIAAYFNLVGYLYTEKVPDQGFVRKLQVEPDLRFIAKNPGGSLPPIVTNPDFTEIFNIVKKGEMNNAEATA